MGKRSKLLALLCGAAFSVAVIPTAQAQNVVDARNTVIGRAYPWQGGGGVVFRVQQIPVYVILEHVGVNTAGNVSPTDLEWARTNVEFTSTDCSGTPLISASASSNPFRPSAVVRNGNTATLYIAGTAPAIPQQIHSSLGLSCAALNIVDPVYSVVTTVDLTHLHPEPLRVP